MGPGNWQQWAPGLPGQRRALDHAERRCMGTGHSCGFSLISPIQYDTTNIHTCQEDPEPETWGNGYLLRKPSWSPLPIQTHLLLWFSVHPGLPIFMAPTTLCYMIHYVFFPALNNKLYAGRALCLTHTCSCTELNTYLWLNKDLLNEQVIHE